MKIPLVTIVTIGNGMMVRELYLCSLLEQGTKGEVFLLL
jgi:hypothetical protein